jgi:hypothetical protein
MQPRPMTVRTELSLRLVVPGGVPMPVRAGMSYDAGDPYAVTVSFYTGSGPTADVVSWTFSRELLTDGVGGATGDGDVRVWPSSCDGQPVVCLSLSSPSGRALFEVPEPELIEFLTMTYVAVPTGSEGDQVDLDGELLMLLSAEPEI